MSTQDLLQAVGVAKAHVGTTARRAHVLLNPPADAMAIALLSASLGRSPPQALMDWLAIHNGEAGPVGLLGLGVHLMTAQEIASPYLFAIGDERVDQDDAFGNEIGRSGSTAIEHLYRGEAFDPNVGFYYLRARWMDPSVGRFTQQDAFAGLPSSPQSLNKYGFTHSDPVNNTDPSGYTNLAESSVASGGYSSLMLSSVPNIMMNTARVAANDALFASAASGAALFRAAGVGIMTSLALTASSSQRDRLIGVPIIVFGQEFPGHADHIRDAQTGNDSSFWSAPFALNRVPAWPRGWYNVDSVAECNREARARFPASRACDEYPFASARQGGPVNYVLGAVSLRLLDLSESDRTRNFIGNFYSNAQLSVDGLSKQSRFIALGIPGVPSFYTDRALNVRFLSGQ